MPGAPVIGVRDSGVGGLTVARCIKQAIPHATLLYFADTAHVPYGDRPPHEVRHYALSISEFLITHGAQIVVFACNTSSAYALAEAQEKFKVPIVGMIEPGVRAALAVSGGTIGVLATQATVTSQVYTHCIQTRRPGTKSVEIPCPEFVPLVENERTQSAAAHHASQRYMEPLLQAGADTVILGCTHYPLLLPALREVAPHIKFVDPAEAVATDVVSLSGDSQRSPANGTLEPVTTNDVFYVSGPVNGVRHWVEKLLPRRDEQQQPVMLTGPVFDVSV